MPLCVAYREGKKNTIFADEWYVTIRRKKWGFISFFFSGGNERGSRKRSANIRNTFQLSNPVTQKCFSFPRALQKLEIWPRHFRKLIANSCNTVFPLKKTENKYFSLKNFCESRRTLVSGNQSCTAAAKVPEKLSGKKRGEIDGGRSPGDISPKSLSLLFVQSTIEWDRSIHPSLSGRGGGGKESWSENHQLYDFKNVNVYQVFLPDFFSFLV